MTDKRQLNSTMTRETKLGPRGDLLYGMSATHNVYFTNDQQTGESWYVRHGLHGSITMSRAEAQDLLAFLQRTLA